MSKKDNDIDDDYGLDDLDFDFNDDFDTTPVKDDRKPIVKATTSFLDSAAKELANPQTLKRMTVNALPEGYGKALNLVDDISAAGSDLYNTTVSELKPVIREAKRVTRRVLPTVKNFLPEKLAKKLDKLTESDSAGASVEETREGMMNAELSNMFKLQMENSAQDKEESTIAEAVERVKGNKRFKTEISALNSIGSGINRLVAYQDQIASRYQRKSLELQYMQYYTLRDTFEIHKASSMETKNQLDIIAKNTGLPEYRKTQLTEASGQLLRERLLNATSSAVKDYGLKYLDKYKDNIKGFVKNNVSSFKDSAMGALSGVETLADSQEMMAEMGQGSDPYSGAGGLAGGMAGDWLGKKISKFAKPMLNRFPGVGKLGNKLLYGVENLPALTSSWAKGDAGENTSSPTWNKVLRGFKNLSPNNLIDNKLGENGLLKADDTVPFTYLARKSITEIIPGYLSRIHHELAIIRTGDPTIERLDFNSRDGSFANLSKVTNSLSSLLFDPEKNLKGTHDTTNALIDELEANSGKKLSPEARKAAFDKFIGSASRVDKSFNVKELGDVDSWSEDLSDEDRLQLSYMFSDDVGEDKQQHFSRKFLNIRDHINNPTDAIKSLAESGQLEHLRSLGLIRGEGDSREVDQDRILDILRRGTVDEIGQGAFDTRIADSGTNGGLGGRGPIPYNPTPTNGPGGLPLPNADDTVVTAQQKQGQVDADRIAEAVRQAVESGNSGSLAQLSEQNQWLMEIYSLMESGNLVTQSMQFGAGGIKGAIANLKDRGKKLGSRIKGMFKVPKLPFGLNTLLSPTKMIGAAGSKIADLWNRGRDKVNKVKELYVAGELFPKLTLAKLQAKEYFDAITGKPILKWEDITGPIKDKYGDWVLSAEDWAKGLRDNKGKAFLDRTKGKLLTKYTALKGVLSKPFDIIRSFKKGIVNFIKKPRDIYLPGNPVPILLASVMSAGGYRNADNSPINSWTDIKGSVYDLEGNVVVSLEMLRAGMVDAAGKKYQSLKDKIFSKAGKIAGFISNQASKFTNDIKSGFKKGMALFKGGFKGIGGKISKKLGRGGSDNEFLETIGEYQILLLEEIRDGIRALKPKKAKGDSDGDGDRDNSYEDLSARRKANREAKEAKKDGVPGAPEKKKRGGLMGLLQAGFGLLAGIPTMLKTLTSTLLMKKGVGALADIAGSAAGGGKKGLLRRGAGALWTGAKWAGRGALAAGSLLGGSTLAGAGTALATGASALGTGLLAVGGAALSVLSSPIVLGAAAVAAVGLGAWWLWKKYKKANLSPFMQVRMAQYGFSVDDTDNHNKMLAFEDLLKSSTSMSGGSAAVNLAKVDMEKLREMFGIDPKDPDTIEQWANWFDVRFKPVYLTSYAMADTLAGGDLSDVDGALKKEDRLAYLKGITIEGGDDIYDMMAGPSADITLTMDADAVNAKLTELSDKLKEEAASDSSTVVEKTPTTLTAAAAAAEAAKTAGGEGGKRSMIDRLKDGAINVLKYTPIGMLVNAGVKLAGVASSMFSWLKDKLFGQEFKMPTILNSEIDPLTSIRYRLYGLNSMEYMRASPLSKLEEAVIKDISYTGKKKAEWDGDAEAICKAIGPLFMADIENEANKKRWMEWFSKRFLPVFINYLTAVKGFLNSGNPFLAYDQLRAPQSLEVARFMIAATQDAESKPSDSASVWSVAGSPFDSYPLNTDPNSVQPFILAIEADARQAMLREKVQVNSVGKAMGITPPSSGPLGMLKLPDQGVSGGKSVSPLQQAMYAATPMSKGAPGYTGGGMSVQNSTGTGGSVNELPNPTGPDGQWSTYKDLILAASKMAGVDPGLMATMAGVESGFRGRVKASGSTATGLYQFIGTTWTEMLQKYGSKYGLDLNAERTDPRANSLMGAEYLKENMVSLEKSLGRKPTDTDLYIAHFLGANGASKFLNADPSGNAAAGMPSAASSNPDIFFDGKSPRSYAQTYAEIDRRLNAFRSKVGNDARATSGMGVLTAATPQVPAITGITPMAKPPGSVGGGVLSTPGTGGAMTYAPKGGTNAALPGLGGEGFTQLPTNPKISATEAKSAGQAVLQREASTDSGTYGILTLPDGTSFQTLELPWRANAEGKSCIPPGTYKVETRNSPKFGPGVYEVKGVSGRSAILIHSGNSAGNTDKGQKSDVQGCILLGMSRGVVGGQAAVIESKAAVASFQQKMGGQPFTMTIIGASGDTLSTTPAAASAAPVGLFPMATPSPIAQAIGAGVGPVASTPMAPVSSNIQMQDMTKPPVTNLSPPEVSLLQKQALERKAAAAQEQNLAVAKAASTDTGSMEGLLAKQLEIQISMDQTLRSIDEGIRVMGGGVNGTNTSSDSGNSQQPIRGNRPATVEVRATPISLRRQGS